jgi:hypothetical protein
MSRSVTLALVDPSGTPLGTLPPFDVGTPYWQETTDVTGGARERYGVEVTVLRLLDCEPRGGAMGGPVTYLAEVEELPARYRGPVAADLTPHPHRASYAEPGGPAASLAWAQAVLGVAVERRVQRRTWNLSSIWWLETAAGPVWLKEVPAFFAHEPAVLRYAAEHGVAVPRLIAADHGAGAGPSATAGAAPRARTGGARMLLAHVDGEDMYDCPFETLLAIAADIHDLHRTADPTALLAAGVPDGRSQPLAERVRDVVARQETVSPELADLVAGLPERLAAVTACGLPDTLLHGDLYPGNVRADATHRWFLDWGDSFVGQPGFDVLRLAERLDPPETAALFDAWAADWERTAPGSDPRRAIDLLRPVHGLYGAVVYDRFLRNIESSERPYHATDVARCLDDAVGGAAGPGAGAGSDG